MCLYIEAYLHLDLSLGVTQSVHAKYASEIRNAQILNFQNTLILLVTRLGNRGLLRFFSYPSSSLGFFDKHGCTYWWLNKNLTHYKHVPCNTLTHSTNEDLLNIKRKGDPEVLYPHSYIWYHWNPEPVCNKSHFVSLFYLYWYFLIY